MLTTATTAFCKCDQVLKANAQEKERRKDTKHAQMWVALQGQLQSRSISTSLVTAKNSSKCAICCQLGYWTKVCPNRKRKSLPNLLAINVSSWVIGLLSAPRVERPLCQSQPQVSKWLHRTEEAPSNWPHCKRFPLLDCSQGYKWMWQVDLLLSFWIQGSPTLSLLLSPNPSPHGPALSWELLRSQFHNIYLHLYVAYEVGIHLLKPFFLGWNAQI